MNIKEVLTSYISNILSDTQVELSGDTKLIEGDYLDSLAIADLLTFIEEQFNIEINVDEYEIENFKDINTIVSFIQGKIK